MNANSHSWKFSCCPSTLRTSPLQTRTATNRSPHNAQLRLVAVLIYRGKLFKVNAQRPNIQQRLCFHITFVKFQLELLTAKFLAPYQLSITTIYSMVVHRRDTHTDEETRLWISAFNGCRFQLSINLRNMNLWNTCTSELSQNRLARARLLTLYSVVSREIIDHPKRDRGPQFKHHWSRFYNL